MRRMMDEGAGGASPSDAETANNNQEVETLNRAGATALARRLEKYWHDRGYMTARFWPEPITERFAKVGTHEIYRVTCNLVNGLPPVYRDHNPPR